MQYQDHPVGHVGGTLKTGVPLKTSGAQQVSNKEAAPIQLLFERLAHAIDSAHTGISVLAEKLAPVSAPRPTGEGVKGESPVATPPSAMEQQLVSLLESVERLNRRIANAHDELRI